jgi:hypothetical protein
MRALHTQELDSVKPEACIHLKGMPQSKLIDEAAALR